MQSIQPYIKLEAEPVFLVLKRRGYAADQSPSSVAEVKNELSHTHSPYAFIA